MKGDIMIQDLDVTDKTKTRVMVHDGDKWAESQEPDQDMKYFQHRLNEWFRKMNEERYAHAMRVLNE